MKKSTEKPLTVRLHTEATLSLLHIYTPQYEYTPYEERLLCALLQSALQRLRPEAIIDATHKTEDEKANIMAAVTEGTSVTPAVVRISGTDYLAKLEESPNAPHPVSLTLIDILSDAQE